MIKTSDAAIFYTDYPVLKYIKSGIKKEKLFVAHNTVEVQPLRMCNEKDIFLFVGTLYRAKGLDLLIESYSELANYLTQCPKLVIVGGGDEYNSILQWVNEKKLNDKIILTGPIYDEDKLAEYFSKAILCISPNQAGLSVQKAMGYGVPFVTKKDAYTGGEIFDIINGKNGILMDDESELYNILLDASNHPQKYYEMGINAKTFYDSNRTIEHMAQGVLDAIDYVLEVTNNGH